MYINSLHIKMGCALSNKSSNRKIPDIIEIINKEDIPTTKGKVYHIKSKLEGKVYHVYYRKISTKR